MDSNNWTVILLDLFFSEGKVSDEVYLKVFLYHFPVQLTSTMWGSA